MKGGAPPTLSQGASSPALPGEQVVHSEEAWKALLEAIEQPEMLMRHKLSFPPGAPAQETKGYAPGGRERTMHVLRDLENKKNPPRTPGQGVLPPAPGSPQPTLTRASFLRPGPAPSMRSSETRDAAPLTSYRGADMWPLLLNGV